MNVYSVCELTNYFPLQNKDEESKQSTSSKASSFVSSKQLYKSQPTLDTFNNRPSQASSSSGWISASKPKLSKPPSLEEDVRDIKETPLLKVIKEDMQESSTRNHLSNGTGTDIEGTNKNEFRNTEDGQGIGKNSQAAKSKYFVPVMDSSDDDYGLFGESSDNGSFSGQKKKVGSGLGQEVKTEKSDLEDKTGDSRKEEEGSKPVLNRSKTVSEAKSSQKKRGVMYDDTDSDKDEENSQDSQKYERILADSKKKMESSGWIDAKRMKKKMKSNSLFKR